MRTNKGFTLLELLVGVAIITISGLGIAGLSSLVSRSTGEANAKFVVSNFKLLLQSTIENPEAWNNTVRANADGSMSCLANKVSCSGGAGGAGSTELASFDLYDAENHLIYKATKENTGFTKTSEVCSEFSQESADCPFRYDLKWKAICPNTGECLNPIISVQGTLQISSRAKNLNSEGNFSVLRGFASNTVQRSCASFGGVFNSSTRQCDRPLLTQACNDKMLAGLTLAGTAVCKPIYSGMCANTDVVTGFEPMTGDPICRAPAEQVPSLDPSAHPVQCAFFGAAEGQTWWAPAGEVWRIEKCAVGEREIDRNLRVDAEMICEGGYVVPTGRTKEIATGTTIGSCTDVACPAGKQVGDLYWIPQPDETEIENCYGSPGIFRNVRYRLEAQFMCSKIGEEATGRINKTEISRDACPILTTDFNKIYSVDASQEKARGKILFVVDNSNSMADAQTALSTGISTFLDDLKDVTLDVKVISTTPPDTGWPESQYTMFEGVNRRVTYPEGTLLTGSPSVGQVYSEETNLQLKSNFKYSITRSSSAAEITKFKTDITNAIRKGGSPIGDPTDFSVATQGSTTEAGLCNALAALYDDGPNKFFNLGDIGAIVFLTDDEDGSLFDGAWYSCKQYAGYLRKALSYQSNYWVSAVTANFQYTITSVIDGVSTPQTINTWFAVPPAVGPQAPYTSCTAAVDAEAQTRVPAGGTYVPGSCSTWALGLAQFSDTTATASIDYCTATNFTITTGSAPGTYANMTAWAQAMYPQYLFIPLSTPGACTRDYTFGIESAGYVFGFKAKPGIYSLPIEQRVHERALELFGKNGFYVTNIINDGTCAYTAGQQTSTKYMTLASLLPADHSVNYPICSGNYAGALKKLSENVATAINNSIIFKLDSNEMMVGVVVQRGGATISVDPSQYSVFGDRIDFTGFPLEETDVVMIAVRATLSDPAR